MGRFEKKKASGLEVFAQLFCYLGRRCLCCTGCFVLIEEAKGRCGTLTAIEQNMEGNTYVHGYVSSQSKLKLRGLLLKIDIDVYIEWVHCLTAVTRVVAMNVHLQGSKL